MTALQDALYLSLLGMAETFRTSRPARIQQCLQCLSAVLKCNPPPRVAARTRLQLGALIFDHTKNVDVARAHLEEAWKMAQQQPHFDDVKLDCISALVDLYQKINEFQLCHLILQQGIELSRGLPFWQCKFLFQLSQIHVYERNYVTALQALSSGAGIAESFNVPFTQILFLLSKAMLQIIEKNVQEVHQSLTLVGQLLDHWNGPINRKEGLKAFFLLLQVCHFLICGQIKSVKPCLKQLQTSIQVITQIAEPNAAVNNYAECFQFLSKDDLCIVVYLAGQIEKSQKYGEKALFQVEKLKAADSEHQLLWTLQLLLLEHISLCRLIIGDKSSALDLISQSCHICFVQPRLLAAQRPQLHTLLGLYAMSVNSMESSETQFNTALRLARDTELWLFINLNLAIVYLRTGREQDFYGLFERINPEKFPSSSHSLRASAYYVRGVQAFFQSRYTEAKKYLRETLKMSNDEGLNRLSSCTLCLLGYIFFSIGNPTESVKMVQPALELASKIPDENIKLWSASLLRDIYRTSSEKDEEEKYSRLSTCCGQSLMKDLFQCTHKREHCLIEWTEGACPLYHNPSDGLYRTKPVLDGNSHNQLL